MRTEAIVVTTFELGFLYDPQCNLQKRWVDFGSDNEEVWKTLFPFLEPTLEKNFPTRARITAVGRFDGPRKEGYGHLSSFRVHFQIMAVEKMEAVNPEVPSPWSDEDSVK